MHDTIEAALMTAALAFGGVDIVVNNAGISISKPIDRSYRLKIGICCMIFW